MTYDEVRAELGFSGADLDEVMEAWKENRAALMTYSDSAVGGPG